MMKKIKHKKTTPWVQPSQKEVIDDAVDSKKRLQKLVKAEKLFAAGGAGSTEAFPHIDTEVLPTEQEAYDATGTDRPSSGMTPQGPSWQTLAQRKRRQRRRCEPGANTSQPCPIDPWWWTALLKLWQILVVLILKSTVLLE
jgi:hypothetical protein